MGNDRGRGRGRVRAFLSVWWLLALWLPMAGHAQIHTPEDEYKDLIRVSQDIEPLGEHPFGADINLYSGSLSFQQTDVSMSGNGPVLKLTRAFRILGPTYRQGRPQRAFGDWEIALPRIETLTSTAGWLVRGSASTQRCTHFGKPPSVAAADGASADWLPKTWWHGYQMVIPGQGSQDLLANPGADRAMYPVVTKNHWRIRCLSSTANGQAGEGFLATAPDGTRYWFNELVYRWAPMLRRPTGSGPITYRDPKPGAFLLASRRAWMGRLIGWLTGTSPAQALPPDDILHRLQAWMLVTKVQDRFGNTLTYSYDSNGHLTDISASDGRKLTVQYVSDSNRIHKVILQPADATSRAWVYGYTGTAAYDMRLTSVTLPDSSQWYFDLAAFDGPASLAQAYEGACLAPGEPVEINTSWTGTITHPSGLKGSFTIKPEKHGRSYVPRWCLGPEPYPTASGSYAAIPNAWYSLTLVKKTFTGAGLPTETWQYSYSDPHASWAVDCAGGCPDTVRTMVLRPDGSSTRYTFSNRYDYTESHLLKTETFSGNTTGLMRMVVNTYATPDGHAWPSTVGNNLQSRINPAQTEKRSPVAKRVIHQSGDTYTWQAEAFNPYAQVTKTRRFNSIAGQQAVEEQTTYHNDTSLWVLGLPETVTNLTAGETVSHYDYNNLDLMTSRRHFGQTAMTYNWNGAGQLASFTDANGHTTTLGSYKRGIPQTITYPDGTSRHLAVDDFGQITSITNQAGDTTQYAYDASGRLTKVTYPGGGMWSPKNFQYDYVTSAERGLAGGHWRRIVSQDDAYHVTWYDALLRPVLTDTFIGGDSGSHISTRTTYNWKGLTVFQSWPVTGSPVLSSITAGATTTYDALGRVTAVSQPSELGTLTTATTYLSGARKQVTDPEGHVTTTSYQVFDQPSYKAVTQVQAPEGIVQSIARNIYGAPTAITQSGSGIVPITKFLYYNSQHRLCRTKEPETRSTLMGYDAVGNLVWSAEGLTVSGNGCGSQPASHIARTYDAMNRLTAVNYLGGQGNIIATITTTYDDLGQVETAKADTISDSVQWTYGYDNLGHLTSESLAMNGLASPWSIHYAYDHSGHVRTVTYPDGKQIAYAPDALGRATKAGGYATGVSYYPDGTLKHFTYGDGQNDYLAQRNTRHLLGNLTVGNPGTGSLVYSQDIVYDKDANITHMTDLTLGGERTKTLSYDALNRLTEANAPNLWGTITYTYDALNNIRSLTRNGVNPKTYNYANNHLTSISSGGTLLHSFAYDPQGNMTQKDSQVHVFSMGHRLLQVPGIATYVYDAAGRRVKAIDAGGNTTYYAYNRAGRLLYQWDAASNTGTDYVYLGRKLIAEVKRSQGSPVLNTPGVSIDQNPNDGSFTVSWTVTSGTSYTLQEQINDGNWNTIYSGATASKTVSGKPGGHYRYRVRTCDGDCSDWGYSVEVGVTPAKPAITVPDDIQSDRYTVSWNRPISTTGFDVQEQVDGGTWQTIHDGTTATSISLPGDQDGTYVYRVRASNTYGTRGWVTSDPVTVLHPPATAPSLNDPGGTDDDGSYTVSWGAVSGATSYQLQQQANGGNWNTVHDDSSRSKAISGQGNGTYGYRVRGCNAAGCSPWSSARQVVVLHPPATPTSISVPSTSSGSVAVDWPAVSTATSYTLQHRKGSGSWSKAYSGSATSRTLTETSTGSYTYRVRACNHSGCSSYRNSSAVAVTIPPASAPSLADPGGTDGNGSYTVSWGAVSGASTYTLQEHASGASWSTIYNGSSRSKAVSGKSNNTWSYRVRACNAGGCGPWSSTRQVVVLHPPTTPGSIDVPSTSSGSVAVDWPAVGTATSYTLQHRKGSGSWSNAYSGSATSRTLTETSTGSYTYRVRACNRSGCSSYRNSSAVAVTIPPASAPSLSVPSSDSNGSYTVSWGSVSGAGSYTLQQQVNGGSWHTQYNGSSRSKAYSGKTNGVDYGYRVRACNEGGCGPWSGTQTVSIAIPPPKPTGVYANERQIKYNMAYLTIVWQGVSGASSYQVRNQSTGAVVWSGTDTSRQVDSGYPPMTPDGFAVRACNAWACSAWVLAIRRQILDPPPVAPDLNAPSGSSSGSYTVNWSAVFHATSYTLQQRVNSSSWHTTYSGSSRSKGYSGKADGTYGYRVRACNSSGCSAWSTTKTVVVAKPPTTPTGLDVYASGPTYRPVVHVSWHAVAHATAYRLERTLPGQSPEVMDMGTATSTSALQMVSGRITYRVRACNAVGCSLWSGYESVMVQAGGWLAAPAASGSTAVSTDNATTEPGGQP